MSPAASRARPGLPLSENRKGDRRGDAGAPVSENGKTPVGAPRALMVRRGNFLWKSGNRFPEPL